MFQKFEIFLTEILFLDFINIIILLFDVFKLIVF